jgi:large subunit ribosomal protein L35e
MVKAYELRTKNKEELNKQLEELKQELASLRVQQVSGNQKVSKM